jgi:phosphotransferase system  glucose/maltose/N-acetylglucosamine-specific IIC component
MLHVWKSSKLFVERMNWMDAGLLKLCLCAFGVLIGVTVPRKKKASTGLLASGVFVATCLPLMNKFLDISEELAEENQK